MPVGLSGQHMVSIQKGKAGASGIGPAAEGSTCHCLQGKTSPSAASVTTMGPVSTSGEAS
jgi:hypothetical protein